MHSAIAEMMEQHRWQDVVHACTAALQVCPANGKLHACLGEAYFQMGDYLHAEPSFKRAYVLDPNLWRSAVRHAQALEKLYRYRDAMDVVTEWIKLKPSNADLLGLQEFLRTQPESEEHDGWERSRRLGTTIINAGFNRTEAPSVGAIVDRSEEVSETAVADPSARQDSLRFGTNRA